MNGGRGRPFCDPPKWQTLASVHKKQSNTMAGKGRRARMTVAQKEVLRSHHKLHPDLKPDELARWAQASFSLLIAP